MPPRPPKPADKEARPRFRARNEASSRNRAIDDAKKLIERESHAVKVDDSFSYLDDRAHAIVRGANVENALDIALTEKIFIHQGERRQLFRTNGPLGTFDNKITMAYALKIFGLKTKQDLDVIRHVRNVFAHAKVLITFDTAEIRKLCELLNCTTLFTKDGQGSAAEKGNPRDLFTTCSIVLERGLIVYAVKQKSETVPYPSIAKDLQSALDNLKFTVESLP